MSTTPTPEPSVLSGTPSSEAVVEVRTVPDPLDEIAVVTQPPQKDTTDPPLLDSARTSTVSSNPTQMSDGGSIRSVPAVQITEAASPVRDTASPLSIETSSLTSPPPLPSPARSQNTQEEPLNAAQQQRRARHRSAIEPRSSNRLSGFFSSFMHRRDLQQPSSREPIRENAQTPEPARATNSEEPSRASSPLPTRPATPPPPPLPAPTLQELGLDLAALTAELSPSHFSSPPHSGAFIAPHYLLLCHAQGLDVLPLTSPPAIQPYALVRRVNFKSVVVMEQRGVMVAIAGRRDGVRIYALEEVKKAIEWRMEFELRRERERSRRDNVKKVSLRSMDLLDVMESTDKPRKASLSTPPPDSDRVRAGILRKSSQTQLPLPPSPPPVPLIPRSATARAPKKRSRGPSLQVNSGLTVPPGPSGFPPPYAGPSEAPPLPTLHSRPSFISLRARGGSVSEVLAAAPSHRTSDAARAPDDSKADWAESSDEEAIDVVAAGASGTHLDERTSSTSANNLSVSSPQMPALIPTPSRPGTGTQQPSRRSRPGNLDLTLARSGTIPPPEPSPAPTLLTIRQALSHSPTTLTNEIPHADTPTFDDDDEEDVDGNISLAQALMESRIPDLPPPGTTRPQEPILLSNSTASVAQLGSTTATSNAQNDGRSSIRTSNSTNTNARRRRRWSIMISSPSTDMADAASDLSNPPQTAPGGSMNRFSRSHSFRSNISQGVSMRSVTDPVSTAATPPFMGHASVPDLSIPQATTPTSSRSSRFIPRIISNALHRRKSSDRFAAPLSSPVENEGTRWSAATQPPPPKLEYVKLPGTKGSLLIKSVETPKKSFLAILCGDNGEKVELFAGTYRTALGLSRTFILPDSPRSLELQLQGDDLVEVFLVFAQNVFGLEPATVRVREVRIGRAERRAARRRARENSSQVPADGDQQEEETNVNVSIGVSVPTESSVPSTENGFERSSSPNLIPNEHPGATSDRPATPEPGPSTTTTAQAEELMLVATAQMGPYTTFQQLNFAPRFPLASIADEYIIPPTYPSYLEYKSQFEGELDAAVVPTVAQTQFCPPGLPIPTPAPPSKWYYKDPKETVHGPWKASLMQAWYKDGLLPPDLPVRREEDEEYILLRDLRLQSVDPTQPFRTLTTTTTTVEPPLAPELPLLPPISLLEQPKHFGPPALFFSSRGGHSTSIVDARGRSVLKGRFLWSSEDSDATKASSGKMGDVRRLEAFDVGAGGSVLVAMRQGGLEAVDLSDALLRPADQSRTALPTYNPGTTTINRRAPFVWKIGTPLTVPQVAPTLPLSAKSHGTFGLSAGRKATAQFSSKTANSKTDSFAADFEVDPQDEVLFLGRKDNEVYFCERNASSFRILKLCPSVEKSGIDTTLRIS